MDVFRPVGEKQVVANLLREITPDEDNTEELVEVLLHEGVDTARGFRLLLQQNGVCNAITTYDQVLAARSKSDRQAGASALLERLHADLVASVQADILRQEGIAPSESTLETLIIDRDWLFNEGAYHIDTTHLAAVVRMARVLEKEEEIRQALDLTHYGRKLSAPLQYQGDEPFVDQYPTNALYFSALLGQNITEAIDYFREKAMLLDPQYHGTEALEVYLELLNRLGRYEEALATACSQLPKQIPYSAYAPVLLELSGKTHDYKAMLEYCRGRNDPLGFTAALLSQAK
jgi:tetratricopeptide (TPR) repeat protein